MASPSTGTSSESSQRRYTAQQALSLILSETSPSLPAMDSDSGEDFARNVDEDFIDSGSEFLPESDSDDSDDGGCGRDQQHKRRRLDLPSASTRDAQAAIRGDYYYFVSQSSY